MISVTIDLSGFDAFADSLRLFPERAPQVLDAAVLEGANKVAVITQNMPAVNVLNNGYDAIGIPVAPKNGGAMRQSIHGRKVGPMESEVIADIQDPPYPFWVHQGTSKMESRPFFDWALNYYGGLQAITDTVQAALEGLFA